MLSFNPHGNISLTPFCRQGHQDSKRWSHVFSVTYGTSGGTGQGSDPGSLLPEPASDHYTSLQLSGFERALFVSSLEAKVSRRNCVPISFWNVSWGEQKRWWRFQGLVKCHDLTQGMRFLRLSSGWPAPFGGHELNRPGKNGSKMSSVPASGVNPGSPVPSFVAPGTH